MNQTAWINDFVGEIQIILARLVQLPINSVRAGTRVTQGGASLITLGTKRALSKKRSEWNEGSEWAFALWNKETERYYTLTELGSQTVPNPIPVYIENFWRPSRPVMQQFSQLYRPATWLPHRQRPSDRGRALVTEAVLSALNKGVGSENFFLTAWIFFSGTSMRCITVNSRCLGLTWKLFRPAKTDYNGSMKWSIPDEDAAPALLSGLVTNE